MRRLAALTIFVLGSSLAGAGTAQTPPAADPLTGTWKLNPAATRVSAGAPLAPPAARTETYRQSESGTIELLLRTTAADGAISTSTLTFNARGGVVRQEGAPAGRMLVETRLGTHEWLVTYLADGVQYLTMRKVISADGQVMRQIFSGVTPRGEVWDGLLVFDRQ
jgi:hypothetical protein